MSLIAASLPLGLVRQDSITRLYGSECFKKIFEGLPISAATPHYTASDGRHLTEEERQLLIENTERLIQKFENEQQEEQTRKSSIAITNPPELPLIQQQTQTQASVVSAESRTTFEIQAKQIVRAKYGIDPDLPGWRGLVQIELQRLLRQNAG